MFEQDLEKKREQCRAKAKQLGEPVLIFTWKDDESPKCLCDLPFSIVPEGLEFETDVVEVVRHD